MNQDEGKSPYTVNETRKSFRSCTRDDFLKVNAADIYDSYQIKESLICLDTQGVILSNSSDSMTK